MVIVRGNHKFCTLLAHYLLHSTLYGWVVVVGCFFFIVPKASETQTTTIIKQALRSRQNATGRKVAHVRIACKSNNFNKQIVERKKKATNNKCTVYLGSNWIEAIWVKLNAGHDYCSRKIHRSFDCRYMEKRACLFSKKCYPLLVSVFFSISSLDALI